MAITAADFELPGGIQSYEQFKKAQTAPKFIEERDVNNEMGQKEFLLLFTKPSTAKPIRALVLCYRSSLSKRQPIFQLGELVLP